MEKVLHVPCKRSLSFLTVVMVGLFLIASPLSVSAVGGADCNAQGGQCTFKDFGGVQSCDTDPDANGNPAHTDLGTLDCSSEQICCTIGSGGNSGNGGGNGSGGQQGYLDYVTFPNPVKLTSAGDVLSAAVTAILGLLAVILVVMIIYGGLMYMFSGSNEDKLIKGRRIITLAIAGFAVVLLAWVIIRVTIAIISSTT